MTASSTTSTALLVPTSFSDRPETAIFCALAGEGMDVHVISDPSAPEIPDLIKAGVKVTQLTLKKMSRSKLSAFIKDYITTHAIQAVYAPRTFSLAASIRAVTGSDTTLVGYRGTTGHLSLFDLGPRLAYTNSRVDKIACVSDAVRDHLIEMRIPAERLVTIPKGHNVEWYEPAKRETLIDLGIPSNAFVVGFCGRVRKVKGVEYLVQALRSVPAEHNVHILIAGEIASRPVRRMASSAEFCDRVHCIGFRQDATALMGACDAFAMPSLKREGLPKALIEAMSQSVPPIGSLAGGIPEIIEDGVSGFLVPPRDASAIAAKITELASNRDRAREIGRNARARIEKSFNIRTTVENMKQIFTSA